MKIKSYQIEECVKKSKFCSYLIYGQNKGLVKEKINKIKEIFSNINKEVEIIKLTNDEIKENPEKLYNEFNTFSLSRNKKLLHILNVKDDIKNIIEETINPNPFCLVLFESGELTPKSRIRKLFEKDKFLSILPCYYDTENDIQGLIDKFFKNNNIPISNSLKSILATHLGSERNIIKNELEKIVLFLKNKKKFNEKDILNCVSDNYYFNFADLNYSICDGNLIRLDKIINQLYLEGVNPITLLRSTAKHFQKILFVNEKIENGLNINDSLKLLKPPIFFLYINQFKQHIRSWKIKLSHKVIERIFDAERLCKLNSKISKTICWRTLRNISSIKYKRLTSS